MNKIILAIVAILISNVKLIGQASCSGSYNTITANCQTFTVGNGTPGSIVLCLTANNIPSGGGTSCSPGGACNPPYSGGGWSPRIVIYTSGGTMVTTWTSATAAGTCYTLSTTDGYAVIYGLCLTSGTSLSWNTINQCGASVCAGTVACSGQPCSSCTSACPACGYAAAPSVTTVTSGCPPTNLAVPFGTGQNYTMCASFTAISTTVSFNAIIQSNCGGGNVSNFSWTLQNAACGGTLQSGTLSNLTFTNLTIGSTYVYCYGFTVPTGASGYCQHTIHWPYFIGAAPLPIELTSFDVFVLNNNVVLEWSTAIEKNNAYFVIERSKDAVNFEYVGKVNGSGSTSEKKNYSFIDYSPYNGITYYRLKQVDYDGSFEYTKFKVISYNSEQDEITIVPNPASDYVKINFICNESKKQTLNIYNNKANLVKSMELNCEAGFNSKEINLSGYEKGLYFISIFSDDKVYKSKLVIN